MLRLHFKSASAFFFNWTTRLGSCSGGGFNSNHPAILLRDASSMPCTIACPVNILSSVLSSIWIQRACKDCRMSSCNHSMVWSASQSEWRVARLHHAPSQRHNRSATFSGFPSAILLISKASPVLHCFGFLDHSVPLHLDFPNWLLQGASHLGAGVS